MSKPFLRISRDQIRIALGVFWVIAALLQCQPRMFSSAFINSVILPSASGQPHFVSAPINFASKLELQHTALFNVGFILAQLLIGILIIKKSTAKYGLLMSFLWAGVIWSLGEAYGGMFSGHSSLLMGAPGAALLYVLIGIAIYPRENKRHPDKWLIFAWSGLWLVGALFQLINGQNTVDGVQSMIMSSQMNAPSWLASFDSSISSLISHLGNSAVLILFVLQALIGIITLVFAGLWRRVAIITGIALSVLFWIVGQNLGGLTTGLSTDVGTGPLVIMLGIVLLAIQYKLPNFLVDLTRPAPSDELDAN